MQIRPRDWFIAKIEVFIGLSLGLELPIGWLFEIFLFIGQERDRRNSGPLKLGRWNKSVVGMMHLCNL